MIDSSRTNTHYTASQKKKKNCQLICRDLQSKWIYQSHIFFPCSAWPVDGSRPPLSRLRDHTHTLLGKTPLDEGPIPDNTKHSQETYTCLLGENQTRNASTQTAADPPRGHWDQQSVTCYLWISQSFRQQFERIDWMFKLMRGKHHKKFLYTACKLFGVQTCPIMVHTGQKQGCLYRSTTPYFAH
jgi:hypothetical protein